MLPRPRGSASAGKEPHPAQLFLCIHRPRRAETHPPGPQVRAGGGGGVDKGHSDHLQKPNTLKKKKRFYLFIF